MSAALVAHEELPAPIAERAASLYEESRTRIFQQTDRMFAWLMLGQWVFAIVIALVFSPYGWSGKVRAIHYHVEVAVFLGAAISSLPIVLAWMRPGWGGTRAVVAVAQMLWSALLIHLTGGRIETHFHVFGSLAFLAFYRDWRVLVPSTIVVAADHFLRGIYWPESVYGVVNPEWWRFLEHASWVVFCDVFLILSCFQSVREMREIASRRAQLERLSETFEAKANERTERLCAVNVELAKMFQELETKTVDLSEALNRERQTQAQLVQAGKLAAVGQLAAGVAHEINNPLAIILGFAQGLERRVAADDPLHLPVSSIMREALRCKALVQELVSFARTAKQTTEDVDPNALLRGAGQLLESRARTQNTRIAFDLAAVPVIRANGTQLQQVIVNLGTNALDALGEGGEVALRSRREFGGVILEVQDNGPGMPADVRARMFEPFFTTKEVGQGTGLGLSLAYEIVQQHGGRIEVQSELGQGTTIALHVPRVSPAELRDSAPQSSRGPT